MEERICLGKRIFYSPLLIGSRGTSSRFSTVFIIIFIFDMVIWVAWHDTKGRSKADSIGHKGVMELQVA